MPACHDNLRCLINNACHDLSLVPQWHMRDTLGLGDRGWVGWQEIQRKEIRRLESRGWGRRELLLGRDSLRCRLRRPLGWETWKHLRQHSFLVREPAIPVADLPGRVGRSAVFWDRAWGWLGLGGLVAGSRGRLAGMSWRPCPAGCHLCCRSSCRHKRESRRGRRRTRPGTVGHWNDGASGVDLLVAVRLTRYVPSDAKHFKRKREKKREKRNDTRFRIWGRRRVQGCWL